MASRVAREKLQRSWAEAWPVALGLWSRFPRLSPPIFCMTKAEEKQEGLDSSFAMIRFRDQGVVISLRQVESLGLGDLALEVLAHEVGHHIYCPANFRSHAAGLSRARFCLPGVERHGPMICNLFADLLLNDRLQRDKGLDMAEVYRRLPASKSQLFLMYLRIYEILWGQEAGSLTQITVSEDVDFDARLGARVVRVYARDWLTGVGRFAALCFPYLAERNDQRWANSQLDTKGAAAGSTESLDPSRGEGERDVVHPALDPKIVGKRAQDGKEGGAAGSPDSTSDGGGKGQCREPFEYRELLQALGLDLTSHDAAVLYYRARARPHLIRFPSMLGPGKSMQQPEGLDVWEPGDPIERLDWFQSAIYSPVLIPGLTTLERSYSEVSDFERSEVAPDLDLFVDCSGSMPNPQERESPITVAGAIVALSALKAGARVRATLWSGARQFETTKDFVRDDKSVLRILTGYLGGGTAFPLHLLRDTYLTGRPRKRPAHILVLSDEGVDTMFNKDEQGTDGESLCAKALAAAGGGGTLALNLYGGPRAFEKRVQQHGYVVHVVSSWEQVVDFARAFSKQKFEARPRRRK